MLTGKLARYFATRFLATVMSTFVGVVVIAAMADYFELMRRGADWPQATAWILAEISMFRIPQLTEHMMPFAVLVGGMSCYLTLSRRLELVVARSAGVSAWQFVSPALVVAFLLGTVATVVYNPIAARLHERSKRIEEQMLNQTPTALQVSSSGFWVRQKSADGSAIINAQTSREQGSSLGGVTVYRFDVDEHFQQRIEAPTAELEQGHWRLDDARIFSPGAPPQSTQTFRLATNLTMAQVRESFATPETVPFWQLPSYIEMADRAGLAAAGYRLQYNELIARPFLLCAMVLLATAVSLRFFRFGGVQKMILGGIGAGFMLFVLQKITEDMSTAQLMAPALAAWIPVLLGGLTGFVALLYQEDG